MGIWRLYKVVTPYVASALSGVDYTQTADVVYMFSLDYPPTKLIRGGHTDWTYSTVTFGPTINPPAGISAAASIPNTTGYSAKTYNYVVTNVSDTLPSQESRASSIVSAVNDLTLSGNFNTLTLPALTAGVDRRIIYREQGGVYGYVGASAGTTFVDMAGLQPVLSDTPPVGDNPFADPGDYPSTGMFHQQRLFMGRTYNVPNGVWFSGSAKYENMDRSRPAKPDDAGAFALVSERVNAVNQIASTDKLMLLSSDAVWSVAGGNDNVITPADIVPKRENGRGSSRLDPQVIDNVVFFQPAKGSAIRTIGYSFQINGYTSSNISIFSPHLLKGHRIVRWAWQEEPGAILWMLRNDGVLLALTWEQEQEVWGFSIMETDGVVEEITTISEGGYDRLYALIRRTINGVQRRFHERLALPHGDDYATACHLDCAITQVYNPPRNEIDQLWHLEGATVSVVYDGWVSHDQVVTGGKLFLPNSYAASITTVGLRYEGELETLPPALASQQGSAHTNRQQIGEVVVRTIDTKGIEIGANGTALEQVDERLGDEGTSPPDIETRDYRVTPDGNWTDSATVIIKQREPLPAHITGVFYDILVSPK